MMIFAWICLRLYKFLVDEYKSRCLAKVGIRSCSLGITVSVRMNAGEQRGKVVKFVTVRFNQRLNLLGPFLSANPSGLAKYWYSCWVTSPKYRVLLPGPCV